MNPLYPLTAMIGAMLLLVWRYLLHRGRLVPVTVEEPDDYGTPVAPTG